MKVSIIIPTAGRPAQVRDAIASLQKFVLLYSNVEVLMVDNNQSEATAEDLKTYCQSLPSPTFRYIREPSPGLGAARHTGYLSAHGEILIFIDDDVELSKTWLDTIITGFEDSSVGLIGGPSIPKFTASIPEWFWKFITPTPYGGWMCPWLSLLDIGHDVDNIDPNYIWGLNFSLRRNVLEKCQGFNPDLVPLHLQRWQGDGETGLTRKIASLNIRARYLQDALLHHLCGPDRINIEYFKKRAFYQGVADSYTFIRDGNPPGAKPKYSRIRKALSQLRRSLKEDSQFSHIRKLTDSAYQAGWDFHQLETLNDPQLLRWIRRPNYLFADIPVEQKNSTQEKNEYSAKI